MIDPKEFNTLFYNAIQTKKSVDKVCKLYYNKNTGKPIEYSMEELEGDYITVTKEQYARGRHDVIVKGNNIVNAADIQYLRKLVPSKDGVSCVSSNVLIIDKSSATMWKLKTEEIL